MLHPKGLWIAIGGGRLADTVAYSIEKRAQFTTTVVTSEVRPRAAELIVVSLGEGAPDYIGISRAGRRIATGQITVVISHLTPIKSMSPEKFRQQLPRKFAKGFQPPTKGEYRPTPKLWEQILKVLASQGGEVRNRIRDLSRIASEGQNWVGRIEGGLEAFERDAIASALQIWRGIPFRKRALHSVVPSKTAPVAPFLARIKSASVREDPQIAHDQTTFPGMEVAQRYQIGASLVLKDRGEYLTILNCNRQPLEETLGVDLIYYSHHFDSFVLVQYKRMTEGKKGPVYRPHHDRSHAQELDRMIQADKILRALPKSGKSDINAFRLSGGGFYVKLCESKTKAALDAGMVSGMYVPLGLWRRLLKSHSVRGPRGGVRITWDNCARRLNNIEFTNLLRHGWIGSAAGRSKLLSDIIEKVLGSGRMLVLAATSASSPSKNLRRDSVGRFASEDDPDAVI